MAKKKLQPNSILTEYAERAVALEPLAAIYVDMKSRIRRDGSDADALAVLAEVHRRANAGETWESIGERIARTSPASEAAPE